MKDYCRLCMYALITFYCTSTSSNSVISCATGCFRAKNFVMHWGFHMIPVDMRLTLEYAADELNESALVWSPIPLIRKHGKVKLRRLNSTIKSGIQCDCYFHFVSIR